MSTYPTQPGQPQTPYYQAPPTNALGIAGFVVSLTGMVVCMGLISPIGLILSLIALTKSPRGFAVAGSIIGALGSLMGVLAVLIASGVIGGGLFSGAYFSMSPTMQAIDDASYYGIDTHFSNNSSTLPDEPTGNALISGYYDEWGNSLKYEPTAGTTDQYTITSSGEDGVFGTLDDIVQYYTAYNWNSHSVAQPDFLDEPETEDIETAFGFAAEKVNKAFPFGTTTLPTGVQVKERAGQLFDTWNTPIKYSPRADGTNYFDLESAGPDRQWGTSDDIKRTYYFAPTGETDSPL